MRSKKAVSNMAMSFLLQAVTILCGLIVPRLIIGTFGSGVNGAISSILQFLYYIILLEAGAGGVVRSALYKPLAHHDLEAVSSIYQATNRFFKLVAYVFVLYLLAVALIYPLYIRDFPYFFTFFLTLTLGLNIFVQYYFGITNQILLQADQKQYIYSVCQIVTTILNTVVTVVLIRLGLGILLIKLVASAVFLVNPVILAGYVRKHYAIRKDCPPDNEAIRQRWAGLGHHIAFLLRGSIDIVLITIFTNIREVSVYSVYYMVISGMERLLSSLFAGIEAAFGNMLANDEQEAIRKNFDLFEMICFSLTTVLFLCTALLILPFVRLYTRGVTDVDYIRPVFAYTLTAASALFCLRMPYATMVFAAGHYRQTKNGAFAEAALNALISVVLVRAWGIVGVAVGTLCALTFRTAQYVVYLSKNILCRSVSEFAKKCAVYAAASAVIILLTRLIRLEIASYPAWLLYAAIVGCVTSAVVFAAGCVFYRRDMAQLLRFLKTAAGRRRG